MFQAQYVTLLTLCCLFITDGTVVRNEDICGAHNGRRLYLELGEKGVLYARNVSFAKNAPLQDTATSENIYVTNSSHEQCSLELVTCPSCVIIVTFKILALSHHCGEGGVMVDSPCRCDYVWISEPPYEDVSGTPFCGLYSPITYRSSTRTLSIALLFSQAHTHAFTLEYTAERNRLHLKGTEMMAAGAKGLNTTGGGILTSPFFPARYPRDLGLEYIITCTTEAPTCRIRLLFSDFQLATVSIMEFYDWNGQRLDVSSGARFRPPVIVSSGPSLLIRFYANGGTGLGYKAFYSFVFGHLYDKSIQPITDCGGYVENLGGAITMMDMVGQGVKMYDCVWLIRPPKNFLHMKTHMYLKVVAFADMAGNTELTIKQGPTSALLPLEVVRHPASQLQPPRHREHVAPVTSGFHVSLRGTFGHASHLAIAYAAFSYMDCFTGSDFLCQNHRCIPSQLNCDGFDHCGDNSDEPATCFRDWEEEPQDRKWHMNKANYYFPKIDRYPDLKTATLVFVASSLGLIILISALIILLYRIGARARQQRELQSRLQTISELLDGARIDEISVSDDPPVYEAPPGYDEVMKLGLESDDTRRKKRRNTNRDSRSRSSPSSYDQDAVQSSSRLIVEAASTSRSSQTTPIPTNSSKEQRIPESPPPPYITPPGTFPRNFTTMVLPPCKTHLKEENTSTLTELLGLGRSIVSRTRNETGSNYRVRRNWLRRSADFSRSFPSSDLPPAPVQGQCLSLDGELLGAYHQDSSEPSRSNPSCTFDSSAPQSSSSADALIDTNRDCKPQGEGGIVGTERVDGELEREEEPEALVEDPGTTVADLRCSKPKEIECSCEGACGCANRALSANSENVLMHENNRQISQIDFEGGRANVLEEEDELDSSYPKNAIIKLLGGGSRSNTRSCRLSSRSRRSSKCSHSSSTGLSTGSFTSGSSGNLGRSFREMSVRSRDSYVTKISTLSSCNSYEKLQDEFEIVSECASAIVYTNPSTIANTPSGTPTSTRERKRARRYSSSDPDSLSKGIKVLDSYLASRKLMSGYQRKQSTAVILFGTPEHRGTRAVMSNSNVDIAISIEDDLQDSIRVRRRSWRSSEDTLSY